LFVLTLLDRREYEVRFESQALIVFAAIAAIAWRARPRGRFDSEPVRPYE
jgi:hypothetical protein